MLNESLEAWTIGMLDQILAVLVLELGQITERITFGLGSVAFPLVPGRSAFAVNNFGLIHTADLLLPLAVQALQERRNQRFSM